MSEETPSDAIDSKIAALGDWRGEALARVRGLIREADPDVVEAVKWKKPTNPAGVPVWEHCGLICTGETYRDKVKLTFARGAALADPSGLFNSSLDGNMRRAIDMREGEDSGRGGPEGARPRRRGRESVAARMSAGEGWPTAFLLPMARPRGHSPLMIRRLIFPLFFMALATPLQAQRQSVGIFGTWGAFRGPDRCYAIAEPYRTPRPGDGRAFASVRLLAGPRSRRPGLFPAEPGQARRLGSPAPDR